jgi:O-antigen/teichoic acid export membrane protein
VTEGEGSSDARTPAVSASRADVTLGIAANPAIGVFGMVSRGFRTRGTQWMFVGAGVAAVGAYLFQVIGARSLGDVGYAPISALWTIQYLIVSVLLYPVETYVTHRVLLRHGRGDAADGSLERIWVWIGAISIVLTAITWMLRNQLFQGLGDLALVVGLVTATYGAFMIVRGRLAGTERFKAYGLVTACESIGRALLASGVVWFAATTRALAWVMPWGAAGAAGLWLVLKRRPREPRAVMVAPSAPHRPARFLALTTGANGILQLLLAGGPLVLVVLGAPPAEVSILFVTLAAARVPLVFVFSGLLSRLLPTFLHLSGSDEGRGLRRTARWVALGTCAAALLGGLAAAAVGSPLLGVLFGRSFAPGSLVAAGVTAGVLLATGSMVLNQVLIAQGSEHLSLASWVVALAATALSVAVTNGTPTARVVTAFVLGEAVALVGLTVGAHRLSIASRLRSRTAPLGAS